MARLSSTQKRAKKKKEREQRDRHWLRSLSLPIPNPPYIPGFVKDRDIERADPGLPREVAMLLAGHERLFHRDCIPVNRNDCTLRRRFIIFKYIRDCLEMDEVFLRVPHPSNGKLVGVVQKDFLEAMVRDRYAWENKTAHCLLLGNPDKTRAAFVWAYTLLVFARNRWRDPRTKADADRLNMTITKLLYSDLESGKPTREELDSEWKRFEDFRSPATVNVGDN